MPDDEVDAAAAADPDVPPLTPAELAQAQAVRPEDRTRVPVYIRLDPDVLDFFKSAGPGHQTRINAALREHVERALHTRSEIAGG